MKIKFDETDIVAQDVMVTYTGANNSINLNVMVNNAKEEFDFYKNLLKNGSINTVTIELPSTQEIQFIVVDPDSSSCSISITDSALNVNYSFVVDKLS